MHWKVACKEPIHFEAHDLIVGTMKSMDALLCGIGLVSSQGASTVKYITPLPYIGLTESGSKLYTSFVFCEGKNHKHFIH